MKNYWLSWKQYLANPQGFEMVWPWWISGSSGNGEYLNIVAAVRAENEDEAKRIVRESFDNVPANLPWRFCEERPPDWSPFSERFPMADWMEWEPCATQ